MSYALVDNASLTAVQRVMGEVVVRTPDTVSGDLAALESLVQAVLFYDDLVCLDNYKAEHREEREKRFGFVRFLDPKLLTNRDTHQLLLRWRRAVEVVHPVRRAAENKRAVVADPSGYE